MSEMEQTADRLIVIGRGRLIADATTEQVINGLGHLRVRVVTPQTDLLQSELKRLGLNVTATGSDELQIEDTTSLEVGRLAHSLNVQLSHLSEVRHSLEDAYMQLTQNEVEYQGHQTDLVGAATGESK